jgi:hypothetical protein
MLSVGRSATVSLPFAVSLQMNQHSRLGVFFFCSKALEVVSRLILIDTTPDYASIIVGCDLRFKSSNLLLFVFMNATICHNGDSLLDPLMALLIA